MSYYIRIDDKDALDWMERLIANSLAGAATSERLRAAYDHLLAWDTALKSTVLSRSAIANSDIPPEILIEEDAVKRELKENPPKRRGRPPKKLTAADPKKAAKKKQSLKKPKEVDPFACPNHPTYGGLRSPRTSCDSCWDIYKRLRPMQYSQARAKFDRQYAATKAKA